MAALMTAIGTIKWVITSLGDANWHLRTLNEVMKLLEEFDEKEGHCPVWLI